VYLALGERVIRRKKEKGLGENSQFRFLHAAFLLRLFLLSVRRFVHPTPYLQWSLLKNSPIFFETNLSKPFSETSNSTSMENR
jgi:hypothetical protein